MPPTDSFATPHPPDELTFATSTGSRLTLGNPFRGTLVVAGAEAGKTTAIALPMIAQFARKGYAGLLYNSESANLATAAREALATAPAPPASTPRTTFRTLDFYTLGQSDKVNPLAPANIPTIAAVMECAVALHVRSDKGGDTFFTKTAQAYLTGIIWYYRNNYPALCTIPHVVATVLQTDFKKVLHLLGTDPSCRPLVQSLITAVEQGAEKQIASIISSLQTEMAPLATSEISWVFNPAVAEGEGFSLDLNNPEHPTLLAITASPTQPQLAAPAISCLIAVALKLMNRQNKHPSFVLLDDDTTIYVPGLEAIPATARSNKMAMVYMTCDMTQLNEAYGKAKTEVLVSCLNNQFFGRPSSSATKELVAQLFHEDHVFSQPTPNLLKRALLAFSGKEAQPKFTSAEKLKKGEFLGVIAGSPPAVFKEAFTPAIVPPVKWRVPSGLSAGEAQAFRAAVEANDQSVRSQVEELLRNHPGTLSALK